MKKKLELMMKRMLKKDMIMLMRHYALQIELYYLSLLASLFNIT